MSEGSPRRPRILFLGESVALAHASRTAAIARTLPADLFEVHLALDPRYAWLAESMPHVRFHRLPSIDPRRLLTAADAGRGPYDAGDVRDYVRVELELYHTTQPDLVVSDSRYSASTSAAHAGIPLAVLTNAHWSPFRRLPFAASPVRRKPWVSALSRTWPARAARRAWNTFRPSPVWEPSKGVQAVNSVREEYGLSPLANGLHLHTDGDHVLYPEPPELVPMDDLPGNHHFIGPILWTPNVSLPPGWDDLPDDRPTVYLTLGSTGGQHRVPALIDRLAELPVSIVVATAGRIEVTRPYANVLSADFLPGLQACRRADVVVCNGGSGTAYQAVANGTPIVGLWSNDDQYMTSMMLAEHGAAVSISCNAPVRRIAQQVQTVLSDRSYTAKAQRVRSLMVQHNAAIEFPKVVNTILSAA